MIVDIVPAPVTNVNGNLPALANYSSLHLATVWRCPPLRIESKGLVKYECHTISKGIQLDSVRMLVMSDYCSPIRIKALYCQDDDV